MKQVTYNKILVTHDGSKIASVALSHALALSCDLNTKLFLLRVIESAGQAMTIVDPMGMTPPMPAMGESAVEIVEEDEKMAKEQLERLKIGLEGSGARHVETAVLEGSAGTEIVDFAKQQKIDIIVMSTHGRSGLGRVLLGSVTDYVVRNAPCPVLVVRAK